jgi:hypothetical protein
MKKHQVKAVEMTRRIRDAHYERFKDRPIEERLAYYRERARAFEADVKQRGSAAKPA